IEENIMTAAPAPISTRLNGSNKIDWRAVMEHLRNLRQLSATLAMLDRRRRGGGQRLTDLSTRSEWNGPGSGPQPPPFFSSPSSLVPALLPFDATAQISVTTFRLYTRVAAPVRRQRPCRRCRSSHVLQPVRTAHCCHPRSWHTGPRMHSDPL